MGSAGINPHGVKCSRGRTAEQTNSIGLYVFRESEAHPPAVRPISLAAGYSPVLPELAENWSSPDLVLFSSSGKLFRESAGQSRTLPNTPNTPSTPSFPRILTLGIGWAAISSFCGLSSTDSVQPFAKGSTQQLWSFRFSGRPIERSCDHSGITAP